MDKRKRRLLCMLEGSGRKSRWVSGAPPLSFKAKKAGTLENYRIYGNTVGGESVGDLVETGEHAGEYKVPVTVEGKNLFDEVYPGMDISSQVTYRPLYVGDGSFTMSSNIPPFIGTMPNTANIFLLSGNVSTGGSFINDGVYNGKPITKQSKDGYITIAYRIYFDYDPRKYKTMINSGSTPLPYEPYHAPVTTPIYLPEQIRKVGDYSDYIDYGSQKFVHRVVRKVFDGTEQFEASERTNVINYLVPVITMGDPQNAINCTSNHISAVSGNKIWANRGVPNAQYVSSFFQSDASKIRFVWNDKYGVVNLAGLTSQLSTWYANGDPLIVDYIIVEPVEEQVTLPALPTLPGTNVLTVGTAVQPSRVEVKGRIKAVG